MATRNECFNFCRVCLVPEESEKFTSVFENNAKMAMKIYKIAGILIMDIDEKVPSLICEKCISDIEAVEKLKMRILDADEYYSMMTQESEKAFLEYGMNKMTNKNKPQRNQKSSSKKIKSEPFFMNVKIKEEPKDDSYERVVENVNPRKRKLMKEYDEVIEPLTPLIPKATPNKLGIHRMVINKSKKTIMKTAASLSSFITPTSSKSKAAAKTSAKSKSTTKKKKKAFTPKIILKDIRKSKTYSRSSSGDIPNQMSLDCDICTDTFDTSLALNEHSVALDSEESFACEVCEETFAKPEYLDLHKKLRHAAE